MNSAFALDPTKPHSVVIVMTKVDPVYVSEAKKTPFPAITRKISTQPADWREKNASLNDSVKILVIGPFPDADISQPSIIFGNVAPACPTPDRTAWLPANQYTFIIISGANLQLLLNNKDLNAYRQFLSAAYPGKF